MGDLFFLPETSHRLSPMCSSFPGCILLPSCPQHPFQIGESVNFSLGRKKWGYRLDRVELNSLIALFKMWCSARKEGFPASSQWNLDWRKWGLPKLCAMKGYMALRLNREERAPAASSLFPHAENLSHNKILSFFLFLTYWSIVDL